MSLTSALTRSINTIAVKLSIAIGNDSPKAGRAKIIALAKAMGLRTPLPDSTSLPIGAAEVTILDHVGAFATFPNLGMAVTPHAILEVRTGDGNVIWRFDRDGPKPRQVMPEQVAKDMIFMMNKVVEEGTGKRALLDGVKVAGKTGTTNAFRDAWFMGYTGNYVGGVWFGNDDYQSTKRMTGGSLPAQIWGQIMAFAHQGIELKPLVGAAPNPPPPRPECRCRSLALPAVATSGAADEECGQHPGAHRARDGRCPQRAAADEPFVDRWARHAGRGNFRFACLAASPPQPEAIDRSVPLRHLLRADAIIAELD